MSQVIVLASFKGSPNGAIVNKYEKDQIVDSREMGDELTAVALKEGWVEEYEAPDDDSEPVTIDDLVVAIENLDKDDPELWTSKNAPKTEALETATGKSVSAELRDEAFALYQASLTTE